MEWLTLIAATIAAAAAAATYWQERRNAAREVMHHHLRVAWMDYLESQQKTGHRPQHARPADHEIEIVLRYLSPWSRTKIRRQWQRHLAAMRKTTINELNEATSSAPKEVEQTAKACLETLQATV